MLGVLGLRITSVVFISSKGCFRVVLTHLKIANFRAVGNPVEIELKPITILVGPNGSGKSTILDAISLVGQSIDQELTPSGELLNFPSWEALFHKLNMKADMTIGVEIDLDKKTGLVLQTYLQHAQVLVPEIPKRLRYEFTWSKSRQGDNYHHKFTINDLTLIEFRRYLQDFQWSQEVILPIEKKLNYSGNIATFLGNTTLDASILYNRVSRDFGDLYQFVIKTFHEQLRGKIYKLYSTRGRVNLFAPSTEDHDWVGVEGQFLIQILSKIYSNAKYREISKKISTWSRKFGIPELGAGWEGQNRLSSSYRDDTFDATLNTALSGFGSRQALVMITQLFWSKPGDVILIEEPEISLHPEAQALLPELFAEVANEGKSLIVSTHSHFLILALSRPVRSGMAKPSDIAVYNLEKTPEGSMPTRLEMSEKGYIKGWIPSFTKIESDLMSEFLESTKK